MGLTELTQPSTSGVFHLAELSAGLVQSSCGPAEQKMLISRSCLLSTVCPLSDPSHHAYSRTPRLPENLPVRTTYSLEACMFIN